MRTRPSPRSFGGGELAPWLDGITSEVTAKGCRTLENFIVMKQGPITRRPGTFYCAATKDSSKASVLIPVTIDDDNSYVIEAGDAYLRFYKNHAQVSLAAAAYEVTSPWSAGDVTDLRWCYIPDEKAMYFTHPSYAMRKLAWTSDASWALTQGIIWPAKPWVEADIYGKGYRTDDFIDWEPINFPAKNPHLAYGKNNYINIGTSVSYTSEDGETWQGGSYPFNPYENAVPLWANTFGVAVGCGTSAAEVCASFDDGGSWVAVSAPTASGSYWCVGYDRYHAIWRIAGNAQGRSEDGETWTAITPPTGNIFAITSDNNGRWVGVGGAGIWCAQSIGSFTRAALDSGGLTGTVFYSVAHGEPGGTGLWVAAGIVFATGSGIIYTSPTGSLWTFAYGDSTASNDRYKQVRWIGNRFVIPWIDNGVYLSSEDGITFTMNTPDVASKTRAALGCAYAYKDGMESFGETDHYPKCTAAHEGRMVLGPTNGEPSTLWGSKVGNLNNFYLGEFSDEAWSYKIASDRNVDIQWMMGGMAGLVVGTRTGEGMLAGSEAEGITPSTAQFKWQSTFGSDNVQPVRVHDYIIFSQRGGEIIRGYVPGAGAQAYQSPDLTQYADHIAEGGVHEFDHQDDPQSIVYAVRHDGTLLALTFEGNTIAWSRIVTDGAIESVAVIPTSGAEDEVWAIVKRDIGGTKRYVEYFDTLKVASKEAAHYVDCGYENAAAGSATIYSEVMPWLAGESVDVLVNGNVVEHSKTISASGTLTISNTAATHIHAGLPCPAYAQTMRMETGSAWGAGMGLSKRNANLLVWVHDTIGGEYGPALSITEAVTFAPTSSLTTDLLIVNYPGTWDRDGYIWVCQRDPLPMTVVAVAPDIETGDA